eukprot:2289766-Heterocapsa_arctica.AAC.1
MVNQLTRHLTAPTTADWNQARRQIRYLRGMLSYTLKLTDHDVNSAKGDINAFADAKWTAGVSRRSTNSGAIYYLDTLITA